MRFVLQLSAVKAMMHAWPHLAQAHPAKLVNRGPVHATQGCGFRRMHHSRLFHMLTRSGLSDTVREAQLSRLLIMLMKYRSFCAHLTRLGLCA